LIDIDNPVFADALAEGAVRYAVDHTGRTAARVVGSPRDSSRARGCGGSTSASDCWSASHSDATARRGGGVVRPDASGASTTDLRHSHFRRAFDRRRRRSHPGSATV
jgi:hypothetical protein